MSRRDIPDLLPGTLDLLILRTLQTGPLHGLAAASIPAARAARLDPTRMLRQD